MYQHQQRNWCLRRVDEETLQDVLQRMNELIVNTVQAIAEDSGFSNVRKFYRIFKDEMGMTPTEYREAMESGEGSVLSPI